MTRRRDEMSLGRTPAYVSRDVGAAELCISPDTWDTWLKEGILPPPCDLGITGTTPRWRWADVDEALSRRKRESSECPPEPFFRGLADGQAKERRRAAS